MFGKDKSFCLEPVNYAVFFTGTEAEKEAAEIAESRNKRDLQMIYRAVKGGAIPCCYTLGDINPVNGLQLFTVLHPSAKYAESLQMTTGILKDGIFQYFTSDSEVSNSEKVERDFMTHSGKDNRIYLYGM